MSFKKSNQRKTTVVLTLTLPFIIIYTILFAYPTFQMVLLSFTDAPLIGDGKWVGLANYKKLFTSTLFFRSLTNTSYFVLLTAIPNTLIGLAIAMMVTRLKGRMQTIILCLFFLPYILPVSVVTMVWDWVLDYQFGVAQPLIKLLYGKKVSVFRDPLWTLPITALVTIWWTNGFNVLLFIAGLRNIPASYYEASALDGATALQQFRRITWPLIWPVTALVLTLQLILQLKIFDQVYLFTYNGPFINTIVMLQLVYREAFELNHGGYASAVAVVFFVVVAAVSVLQYQLLKARGHHEI